MIELFKALLLWLIWLKNRAIDEHLNVIHKAENEDKRIYEENILREIVFVKYQYDILQRTNV